MKNILSKINSFIKVIMPYTSIIAIIIGVMNIVFIKQAQDDIRQTQEEISNVRSQVNHIENAVNNISMDYDNSDVLNLINQSHKKIMERIDDVQSDLEWEISCVKRRL